RTCSGSSILAGGRTAEGAAILNFGGGSAIQIRSRPLMPIAKGPLPNFFSRRPRSMARAIMPCMADAVTLRCARHSAIDHMLGCGRVLSCSGVRPDTSSCARRRDSLIWRETDSESKIMAHRRGTQRLNSAISLLPFNGPGRLGRNVINHAVDATNLVHDAVGDRLEDFMGQRHPVCGHAVLRMDRTDGTAHSVGTSVAHDAHRHNRQ